MLPLMIPSVPIWIEQFVYKRFKVVLVKKADPPDFGFVNMGKKFANVWADMPGVWKGLVPTVKACQVFTELKKLWCVWRVVRKWPCSALFWFSFWLHNVLVLQAKCGLPLGEGVQLGHPCFNEVLEPFFCWESMHRCQVVAEFFDWLAWVASRDGAKVRLMVFFKVAINFVLNKWNITKSRWLRESVQMYCNGCCNSPNCIQFTNHVTPVQSINNWNDAKELKNCNYVALVCLESS